MTGGPDAADPPGVFLNCPFDEAFKPLQDAIVFTCVYAGFQPVMAASSGRTGKPRLERILDELRACQHSIHDLSRCRGEGGENLARFNMPLELGMAMAMGHEYLVLVPESNHLHQRYISDLAGLDPQQHDETVERVVAETLAWLVAASDAPSSIQPQDVLDRLPRFASALAKLQLDWKGSEVPWQHVIRVATEAAT